MSDGDGDEEAEIEDATDGVKDYGEFARFAAATAKHSRRGVEARQRYLDELEATGSMSAARRAADRTETTVLRWRSQLPRFREAELALRRMHAERHRDLDVEQLKEVVAGREQWQGGFEKFRLDFLRTDTPDFQRTLVDSYENTPLGNISMILVPPEHGKTTLFEDFVCYKLALDPSFRFTVAGGNLSLARRILGRIQLRMASDGRYTEMVAAFGPFEPQVKGDGVKASKIKQPWGATEMSVYRKRQFDDREANVQALGFRATVKGTRTDHLHCDDIQDRKNLGHTDKILLEFRDDWLSRPGEHGRTTMNGTPIGPDDVYHTLENDEALHDILTVHKMPAIVTDPRTGEDRPLWHERYTMAQLDRIRRKASEPVWKASYMMKPIPLGTPMFDDAAIDTATNGHLSINDIDRIDKNAPCVIGVDPNLGRGRTAIILVQLLPERMKVLRCQVLPNLQRFEAIYSAIDDLAFWAERQGLYVTDVKIEANAFQRGLIHDDRMLAMQSRYGFGITGHTTSQSNKQHAEESIPVMAASMRRGEIEIPWADVGDTRREMEPIVADLEIWRPGKSGKELRQDCVMALWFCWMVWRARRPTIEAEAAGQSIVTAGLPFTPTEWKPLTSGPLWTPEQRKRAS